MFAASNLYLYIVVALFCISAILIIFRIRTCNNPATRARIARGDGIVFAQGIPQLVRPTWNESYIALPIAKRWEVKGMSVPLSLVNQAEINQKGSQDAPRLPKPGDALQLAVFVAMPFRSPGKEDCHEIPVDLGVVALRLQE
ncbi:hypothetical protein VNI00_014789 [Paramarasmius palmivorus]|uniref:Uncharacterized protein n=1 Tax=Paramarasmius palmivorus TaxID=297713 RepID=A0AAW0BRZ8_9AGAR